MRQISNVPQLKDIRRQLRRERSPAEHVLWRHLRRRQFLNLKFRRQHSIGRYILDFYCPALRLAIEIDGDSHFEEHGQQHDTIRDRFLTNLGIRTIRFRNDEVISATENVLERLHDFVTTPTPPPLRRGQKKQPLNP